VFGVVRCLQPGVEALGYVKRTTPPLLSSMSFLSVVFTPSFVSISPPNPPRVIVSPTAIFDALALAEPLLLEALGLLIASLTFATAFATGPFFFAGGAAAGAASGALRLRNSGGILRVCEGGCDVRVGG
jgi:hypothetical protein